MKRLSRVSPSGHDNPGLELSDAVPTQSMQQYTGSSTSVRSTSVVRSVSQWASYARGRWKRATRKCMKRKASGESLSNKYKGLAWEEDVLDGATKEHQLNKRLLDHFRVLAANNEDTDEVDLQYLNEILRDGADPNSADKYGQTALHEISRAWNIDVMRFFLERGADIHRPDAFGVTPLHVAAALDYEDMIRFLLERGADAEAQTYRDMQTPLHFAAKNDATEAIQVLLQSGADIAAHDYKQRTPLQLAANLDRSEAAQTLLELGADAGVQDSDGQLCITAMIGKMTPVANLALNQFHVKDRMTRQQFFYLHLLEPERTRQKVPRGKTRSEPTSPLEFIVHQGKLDLIMHPVVLKLITVKWNLYGRFGAWILLLLNFLFIVSWTIVAISVSVSPDEKKRYVFPQFGQVTISWKSQFLSLRAAGSSFDLMAPFFSPILIVSCEAFYREDWWRVFVVMIALGLTVLEVYRELMEILHSVRRLKDWQQWCEQRLNEDLACTHPMWPEERHYFEGQIKFIRSIKGSYMQDPWNIFDWLVYTLLIVVLGLHMADVYLVSQTLRMYSLRMFAVAVIVLWLRLMKHVRAFRVMGPFIVMLGNIVGDVLRFLFLYAEIYVPYACAFWIIFGGLTAVPSMQTVPQMLYSLYRITLVDDYEFDAMVAVDPVMAHLLCGTFLALSAVLCVNLMIALLSDTFQRVYDNALANAVMQQAAIILLVEESMPYLRHFYDRQYIHSCCAPLGEFYDNDLLTDPDQHERMKKLTAEIKDTLDEYLKIQKEAKLLNQGEPGDGNQSPRNSSSSQHEHLSSLMRLEKDQQQQIQDLQDLRDDVKKLQGLMLQLLQTRTTPLHDAPNTASEGL